MCRAAHTKRWPMKGNMTTPKEFFEQGSHNPELGVSSRDWYAIGSAFLPPIEHEGHTIVCARNLLCTDVASFFAMGFEIVPRSPEPTKASDIIPLLERVFREHGMPKQGVVISHSAWVSSYEMIADPDLSDRGETLSDFNVSFGEMTILEKEKITNWIEQRGIKCEFDGNKILR